MVEPFEWTLASLNAAAGFAGAALLARNFAKTGTRSGKAARWLAFVGMYFLECVAIVGFMLAPVGATGLAMVWGIVLGLRLRKRATPHEAIKKAFLVSVYTSLPAASFLTVVVVAPFCGWSVTSPADGARFGIPGFFPWPVNTMLGFYAALALGVFVIKTIITTGEVSLILHLAGRPRT